MTDQHEMTLELREWLDESFESLPDGSAIAARVRADVHQAPQQHGRWPRFDTGGFQSMLSATKFVVASAIVALFGGFLLAGVLTQPRGEPVPAADASDSPSPTASRAGDGVATDDAWWHGWAGGVARIDAATTEMIVIPTASDPAWLLPIGDAIWALGDDIHRIDRASLSVTDSIDIRGGPAVVAEDSLWLWSVRLGRSSLVEIDLRTRTVSGQYIVDDDLRIGGDEGAGWISTFDDAIWLHEWAHGDSGGSLAKAGHSLTRFDLKTREFTDRIGIDETAKRGNRSCCIAVDGAIWLHGPTGTSLMRFDVATLEVTDTLEFGSELGGGIAAAGAIWINGGPDTRTVHRIDPVTREVTDIAVVTFRYRAPGYGDEAIWVAGGGPLSRIDVDTLEVTEICAPPSCGADFTPLVADGVAWLDGNTSAFRVDLVTGESTRLR